MTTIALEFPPLEPRGGAYKRAAGSLGGHHYFTAVQCRPTFGGLGQHTTDTKMNVEDFRKNGKEMIDYICDYVGGISERRVTPAVEPGYLRPLLPSTAPLKPESWSDIMADVEEKIMPGVTHWQHPRFHAYFPSGNSFPSILGDMLSDAIGCIGFSWAASPACTELETIVLDWLGQAIGLPKEFLAFSEGSKGGGVIQTCASECVLVSMLAAREQAILKLKQDNPNGTDGELLNTLVAYCSKEAHSCVEKAAKICMVKLRILDPDNQCSLRGNTVRDAMHADMESGLTPFFMSTTLGSTSCCSFDNLVEIGPVCSDLDVWMHVDSAYAGNAFICEEFKPLMRGIEHASSFNTNPNKWLLTNFDCSTMWVRDRFKLTQALVVDPLYLQHNYSAQSIDYRHWGVPLSRRFRALKLWFVLRSYGIDGLQRYIRNHCTLAKRFEQLVLKDSRFEVANDVKMGLVCFRLKGEDKLTQELLAKINISGQLHMIPSLVNNRYIIRFCVTAEHATENDIDFAWSVVSDMAAEILSDPNNRQRRQSLLKRRLSFVRSVSRDVFQRSNSRSSLYDGCSPVIILDENDLEIKEDVFTFAPMKEELNEEIKSK